jgi:hypothetical protein
MLRICRLTNTNIYILILPLFLVLFLLITAGLITFSFFVCGYAVLIMLNLGEIIHLLQKLSAFTGISSLYNAFVE